MQLQYARCLGRGRAGETRLGWICGQRSGRVDKLETFFCKIHEFHNPVPVAPAVIVPAFIPVPPRYAISFVPALNTVSAVSTVNDAVSGSGSVPSTEFSVVSSANFVISSCIGSTQ